MTLRDVYTLPRQSEYREIDRLHFRSICPGRTTLGITALFFLKVSAYL